LAVAPHLEAIRISNFRSILDPLDVPLKSKMTFLVGQNNSGKTGILRQLGLLLNNQAINQEDLSSLTIEIPKTEFVFSSVAIRELSQSYQHMPNAFLQNPFPQFTIARTFGPPIVNRLTEDFFAVIDFNYFEGKDKFLKDFGSASSRDQNIDRLLNALWPRLVIPQTVYVPSHRIILQGVASMPQFGQLEFPGTKIHLHTIVADLATLGRPFGNPNERENARKKLANISSFIAYCIEAKEVEIQIPDGKQTIYISIDGNEQPISNLGSGIEQLIVIGMGSFMFPGHIVLIDEPEIHFHPRTQKRMMKYLHDNADAKFVIATHSAAILDSVEADIVQVWQKDHKCFGRTVQNNADHYEAIRNLGHSPSELVLANFVIWVEGPSDRIYFNHWIKKLDSSLIEGIDYAIIFYGGSVLARHGFEDDGSDEDLVKALSVSRNFAVFMDSDKSSEIDYLKPRVQRVANEVAANGGLCWISDCREIENYIPESVIEHLKNFEFNPLNKWNRVVKKDKFDKMKLAEQACELWQDEWPHDLRAKCEDLVERIRAAR
jgi:predicted ATPase